MPACWIAISRLSWQFVVDGIKHFLTRPDTPYHSAVEWCTEGYTTLTPLGKWLRLPLHTTLTSTAHYIPQTLRSSHTFIEFSLKLSDISSTLRTLLYINSPNLTTSVKKEEVSRGVSLRYRSYHSHLTISPSHLTSSHWMIVPTTLMLFSTSCIYLIPKSGNSSKLWQSCEKCFCL